jgi:hypothetical protein
LNARPGVKIASRHAICRQRRPLFDGVEILRDRRKSHVEARPDLVKLAKALARKKPKGGKLSLRAISAEFAAQGFLNERGRPFNPKSVAAMLATRAQ